MDLQEHCFSVITADRSLDLQVNAEVEKRDDWVRVFRLLTLIRWLEDTPFAEEQLIEEEVTKEAKEEKPDGQLLDLNHSDDPPVRVFEREAREFLIVSHFHVSITSEEYYSYCAHSYRKKIT